MKEYKLQEIFDLPEGIEYINADSHFEIKNGVLYSWFKPNDKQSVRLTKMYVNMKFTMIQKPIRFMDVVNSDKKCRVKHELIENDLYREYYNNLDDILKVMLDWYTLEEFKKVIKEAEWYLED